MIRKYQLQFMFVINCNNSVKLVHFPKHNLHIWAEPWNDLQEKKDYLDFIWVGIYDYGLEFMFGYYIFFTFVTKYETLWAWIYLNI